MGWIQTVSAKENTCDLQGTSSFRLTCEDSSKKIKISISGMDARSISQMEVTSDKMKDEFSYEKGRMDQQAAFERVEEGIFQLTTLLNGQLIEVMGIPRTFKITQSSGQQGSTKLAGTFSAFVWAELRNSDEKKELPVLCQTTVVTCPRSKIDFKK